MKGKKRYTYAPYIAILIFSTGVFFMPFGSGDELWNYNFARGIVHGLRPYTDISMVQTPLSAYVSSLFLLLFGDGLFSFRIAEYVLMICTALLLYKLCLGISGSQTIAFALTMFVFSLQLLIWVYSYNYLTVTLVLAVMLLFQGEKEHDYLAALIFGLFPLIKQSSGAILFLGFTAICLLELFREKKDRRIVFRKCVLAVSPLTVYLIYLLASESFSDFWEYAVLGVSTFTHRTTYISFALSNPAWFIFAMLPWLVYARVAYEFIKHGYDGKKARCAIAALACLSLAYPLCDVYHYCAAIVPLIPLFFMFVRPQKISKSSAFMCSAFAVAVMAASIVSATAIMSDVYTAGSINNYEGVPIKGSDEAGIREIDDYIIRMKSEGYEVYIADESAAAYMIPLDSYQKNWDMLLVGNIGVETCQTLLETDRPSIYLVAKDDAALSKQAHIELINFIRNSYTYIDEVLCFDVYRNE